MSITQQIPALPTPPQRSDPANFDDRADAFLGALPAYGGAQNTWAGQANALAVTMNSAGAAATTAQTTAAQAATTAAQAATTATAAQTAITSGLAQTAGETASVVAHNAAPNAHPVEHAQLLGQLGYALDLAGIASRAISGGRIRLQGGSAASPAIRIGADAGIYQSAPGTLSVSIAGVERLRITATGIQVTGGSVTSL